MSPVSPLIQIIRTRLSPFTKEAQAFKEAQQPLTRPTAGRSFAIATGTKPSDWRVLGDVSTTFDNQGRAFLCYLAFDRLGTTSYWAHNAGRNGIFVRRSLDGGKTWEKDAAALKVFATGPRTGHSI